MAELVSVLGRPTKMKKTSSSMLPEWTKLPEELLDVILSEKLDNCFDVVHARSVCSKWRSSFPFPSCLVRPSYSLPTYPIEKVGLWDLEKIPLFLFRSRAATSEFFVGGVGKDDPMLDRPPPLQCSVKAKITRFDHTVRNMVDCQIVPLGHQYRFICWNPEGGKTVKRIVAFLPLSKGGEEFVVLYHYSRNLLVLKSAERKWVRLSNVPHSVCTGLVTFRGRFYATFRNRKIFVIDPYSLEATLLMMPTPRLRANNYLVQSGNDELFLVQKNSIFRRFAFRVSKLDEKAGRWVEVSELGDRVLLLGEMGNVSFFAKNLPDGCGVSGNSVLFTNETGKEGKETNFFIYDLNSWRLSSKNRVTILNKVPALSFRVDGRVLRHVL